MVPISRVYIPPSCMSWGRGKGARGPGSRGGPGSWLSRNMWAVLGVGKPWAGSPQRAETPLPLLNLQIGTHNMGFSAEFPAKKRAGESNILMTSKTYPKNLSRLFFASKIIFEVILQDPLKNTL